MPISKKQLEDRRSYLKKKQSNNPVKKKKPTTVAEKTEAINRCMDTNTKIPHDLRSEAKDILNEIIYKQKDAEEVYSWPLIHVTTSHNPSTSLKEFSKHFALIFNGKYITRSKQTEEELAESCRQNKVTHLFVINETKGNPSGIILSKFPYGKTYYFNMTGVKFKRRTHSLKERAGLVLDGFGSKIGLALKKDLCLMINNDQKLNKHCERVIGIVNRGGNIGFRHYLVEKNKLKDDLFFTMKLYKMSAGTFEMEGDVEYHFSGYKNIVNYDILTRD